MEAALQKSCRRHFVTEQMVTRSSMYGHVVLETDVFDCVRVIIHVNCICLIARHKCIRHLGLMKFHTQDEKETTDLLLA